MMIKVFSTFITLFAVLSLVLNKGFTYYAILFQLSSILLTFVKYRYFRKLSAIFILNSHYNILKLNYLFFFASLY